MLKKSLIGSLLILSTLSACNSEPQNFIGESDNWQVQLKTVEGDNGADVVDFILSYKGSDIESVGSVDYKVDGKSFIIETMDGRLNEEGILKIEGQEINYEKSNPIVSAIEWGGQSEKITLNNQDSN